MEVLTADSITGTFTPVGTYATEFTSEVRGGTGYWIMWEGIEPEFADALASMIDGFASTNALYAAVAMDTIYDQGLTGNISKLYNALAGMPSNDPQALAAAFAQLHGEIFAANKEAAAQLQRKFLRHLPGTKDRLWNNTNGTYLGQSPCEPCGV